MKKLINPTALFDGKPFGMSQAVVYLKENLVFISGQVAWDLEHKVTQTDFSGQMKQALANLNIALEASGSCVEHLLNVRIYIRGEFGERMALAAPLLAEFLKNSRPAVTGVGVASLASPETLVEIEAIAAVNGDQETD